MVTQAIEASAEQAWPPFVLVVGLLLVGPVVAADGLFDALGARLGQARVSPRSLLFALLSLVAVVTAVLNLDTSVVFLTPVLVHAARQRGLDERPFLYGSVFMANAASLLLPGSNLTNLLVLRGDPQSGAVFALRMLPAWITACLVTTSFLMLAFRLEPRPQHEAALPQLRVSVGAAAALAAAALVLALPSPALPVLAVGILASALRRIPPQLDARIFALLFALTVGLGALARLWSAPAQLLGSGGAFAAVGIGAATSIVVNNLPAAMLLSAHPVAHPGALLLGLDIGPNLAITGSLSAILWLRAARTVNAQPSITTYTRLGLLLVPLSLATTFTALTGPFWGHS